jgi:hypothetical protein
LKTSIVIVFALLTIAALVWAGWSRRLHGRYIDPNHTYIEFAYSGKAFTNLNAGGLETEITYERDGSRVVLHELDGNPTLLIQADGSLCCGPGGAYQLARH